MIMCYYFVTLSAFTTKMYEYYYQITESLNDVLSYLKLDISITLSGKVWTLWNIQIKSNFLFQSNMYVILQIQIKMWLPNLTHFSLSLLYCNTKFYLFSTKLITKQYFYRLQTLVTDTFNG